jgi:hypothetical protein
VENWLNCDFIVMLANEFPNHFLYLTMIKLPEKYEQNFDISSEAAKALPDEASSLETSKFYLYFLRSGILLNRPFFLLSEILI